MSVQGRCRWCVRYSTARSRCRPIIPRPARCTKKCSPRWAPERGSRRQRHHEDPAGRQIAGLCIRVALAVDDADREAHRGVHSSNFPSKTRLTMESRRKLFLCRLTTTPELSITNTYNNDSHTHMKVVLPFLGTPSTSASGYCCLVVRNQDIPPQNLCFRTDS